MKTKADLLALLRKIEHTMVKDYPDNPWIAGADAKPLLAEIRNATSEDATDAVTGMLKVARDTVLVLHTAAARLEHAGQPVFSNTVNDHKTKLCGAIELLSKHVE